MQTYYFRLLKLVEFYIRDLLGLRLRLARLAQVKHLERRFQQRCALVFFLHTFCYGGTVDLHRVHDQSTS